MSQTQTAEPAARRRFGIKPRDKNREFFKNKPLYKKLFDAFPAFHKTYADGEVSLSLENLGKFLGFSRNALYRWCNGQNMRSDNARAIVAKSDGRLKFEDFVEHL
ncbi:hypothetical protein AEAC466_04550 [Asticcacaulis sp. AC466]|uniref:hypothetical protein n=1 Tax=Asticcacaulis sp. AC466 TaxID=1282362 RepID=UPI0003C3BA54|nr:hypothetical protein [Asticcacaulis sp. AC466]ESQ85439.1 hypothetical protein AEAC466_04550 [Asticcacaulis sp. AC466]